MMLYTFGHYKPQRLSHKLRAGYMPVWRRMPIWIDGRKCQGWASAEATFGDKVADVGVTMIDPDDARVSGLDHYLGRGGRLDSFAFR